ncbi:hypothetical protein COLO4_04256 [Corchorus olitorius]|uniref:Uncharacterized protein n=1 Tax=Corchorus olitorius TaxID=93759 RepID=A0A1R3KUM2_9ROSI|nr:hypothetical protein COLO4_04256 [Corchorus olitorius]
MSNHYCSDIGKSSANPCHSPGPVLENRQDLQLGWFKKLNIDDKEQLIRELSIKVQGNNTVSMEKLPNEKEEDFKTRHFQELMKKLSSSSKRRTVGSKILKAYLKVHQQRPSPNLYKLDEHAKEQYLFKHEQFTKLKSIDSRQGLLGLHQQASTSDEDSSLNPELFKIKTLDISGGRPQGGQGNQQDNQG